MIRHTFRNCHLQRYIEWRINQYRISFYSMHSLDNSFLLQISFIYWNCDIANLNIKEINESFIKVMVDNTIVYACMHVPVCGITKHLDCIYTFYDGYVF